MEPMTDLTHEVFSYISTLSNGFKSEVDDVEVIEREEAVDTIPVLCWMMLQGFLDCGEYQLAEA
ncbi:MAG: hypothetical protein Q8O98_00370 [bacterium]|nr:hypothetical protein [bacterium]